MGVQGGRWGKSLDLYTSRRFPGRVGEGIADRWPPVTSGGFSPALPLHGTLPYD